MNSTAFPLPDRDLHPLPVFMAFTPFIRHHRSPHSRQNTRSDTGTGDPPATARTFSGHRTGIGNAPATCRNSATCRAPPYCPFPVRTPPTIRPVPNNPRHDRAIPHPSHSPRSSRPLPSAATKRQVSRTGAPFTHTARTVRINVCPQDRTGTGNHAIPPYRTRPALPVPRHPHRPPAGDNTGSARHDLSLIHI